MCGLTGYSGKKNFNPDKIKMLMLANMTRGVHSTGMFNQGKVIKEADYAITFLAENDILPEKLFIGHDRAATVGNKHDAENAHPFQYGSTVGVHNGTLKNHWNLIRAADKSVTDFDVDSQVLIYLLNEDKENFKVLQEFEGAAAVLWHDMDDPKTLFVYRNKERPLFRGYIDDNMYISSIDESLELIGCSKVKEFKTEYLYVIKNGEIIMSKSKHIKHKALKTTYNNYSHNNNKKNSSKQYSSPSNLKEDNKSDWVKRKPGNKNSLFEDNKYYKVISDSGFESWNIKSKDNAPTVSLKSNFENREDLEINGYVICPKGDSNHINDNEVLYLRGLELQNGITYAVLEKVDETDDVYTWPKHNIRNATKAEIASAVSSKDSSFIESDDDQLTPEEQERFTFENDELHFDKDGNRLGTLWVEIGEMYENLINVSEEISDTLTALDNFKATARLSSNEEKVISKIIIGTEGIDKNLDRQVDEILEKSFTLYSDEIH